MSSRRNWRARSLPSRISKALNVARQALEVAQVGFDLQAQAETVLAAQVGQEVVNLRVELEAVGALGHRHQDIQADPLVEQGGDIHRGALRRQLGGQLVAQFHQAQGAGIEAFTERFEQGPVLGEGAQYAFGVDHRGTVARLRKNADCTGKRGAPALSRGRHRRGACSASNHRLTVRNTP